MAATTDRPTDRHTQRALVAYALRRATPLFPYRPPARAYPSPAVLASIDLGSIDAPLVALSLPPAPAGFCAVSRLLM